MKDAIEVEQLVKSYGDLPAVRNVSLRVPKGSVFGLLGANGAGKTTAIECMLGLKSRDSGTVSVLGMNPHTDRKTLFERVGVQLQEANYQDKITVGELCEVTQSLYRNAADYKKLLGRFGISDKIKAPVNELSGGQKQRLFIVLALIPDPEVVFLDELTTGLDTRARRDVWKMLKELKTGGLTIFLASHFMDEVETLCDTICILKHGEAVFYGTVAEAISSSSKSTLEDAYLWYTDEEDTIDESL